MKCGVFGRDPAIVTLTQHEEDECLSVAIECAQEIGILPKESKGSKSAALANNAPSAKGLPSEGDLDCTTFTTRTAVENLRSNRGP